MTAGRAATLPDPGYALPQRLFVGPDECRVRVLPEDGGPPADIDLMKLPVAQELREWLAVAVCGATGPSGPRRSMASALDTLSILKRFTRYLATLQRPPTRPDQLRKAHIDGFILAGGKCLHRDLGSLRSILRYAPDPPTGFWSRLVQATVLKSDGAVTSYTEAEFRRITTTARTQVRAAANRIRHHRDLLARWREGAIGRGDRDRWEQGWILDHVDRHGDVPRDPNSRGGIVVPGVVLRHGGPSAAVARLHLTYAEAAAATTLLICLTGQNLGVLGAATTRHHRPDAHAGGQPTAVIDLVKPRRGSQRAAMTVPLQDVPVDPDDAAEPAVSEPAGGGPVRDELATPFGVYTLLIDLAADTRRWLGTDRLLACYSSGGRHGRGFRAGTAKQSLQLWSAGLGLRCDPPAHPAAESGGNTADDPGDPPPLVVDARRLRLTWLEIHQRPVDSGTLIRHQLGIFFGHQAGLA